MDDTKLYLPSQFKLPLLDAFYLVLDPELRHVEAVVLQMTVSSTHKGSARGFAFLQRLKDHLASLDTQRLDPAGERQRRAAWSVSFVYRLVVPRPSEYQGDYTFTWSLPIKFPSSISGPVYIQLVSSQVRHILPLLTLTNTLPFISSLPHYLLKRTSPVSRKTTIEPCTLSCGFSICCMIVDCIKTIYFYSYEYCTYKTNNITSHNIHGGKGT